MDIEKIDLYNNKLHSIMKLFSSEEMIKTFIAASYFREIWEKDNKFLNAKIQMLMGYSTKLKNDKAKLLYKYSDFKKIQEVTNDIFNKYYNSFLIKDENVPIYTKSEKEEKLVQLITIAKHMFYKKDGYTILIFNFGMELYREINLMLTNIYGFNYEDLQKLYIYVTKIYVKKMREFQINIENYGRKLLNMNEKESIDEKLNEYAIEYLKADLFEIKKEELYQVFGERKINSIINIYGNSLSKNSNKDYNYLSDFNDLLSHPILDFDDYIIIPDIRCGINNLPKLLNYSLVGIKNDGKIRISEQDRGVFKNIYSKTRGDAIEECVVNYFTRIFPRKNIYRSLKYGKGSDCEADVTVVLDKYIIVCECKGKLLTLSSLQGNIHSIKEDFKKGIQKAYDQAYRTQQNIKKGTIFYDEGKRININAKAKVIKICITGENFGFIASDPCLLLKKENDDNYPIIYSIYDLNFITKELNQNELIEFFSYREKISDAVNTIEEADIVSEFLYINSNGKKKEDLNIYDYREISNIKCGIDNKYLKEYEKFIENYKI